MFPCLTTPPHTPSLLVLSQHLFIPIVPSEMLDFCTAPMPFLVGLRPSEFQSLLDMRAGEVGIFANGMSQWNERSPSSLPPPPPNVPTPSPTCSSLPSP